MTRARRAAAPTILAWAGLLLASAAAAPARAAAQSCAPGDGPGLAATAGAAYWRVVGGLSGPAVGLHGTLAPKGVPLEVGYRRVLLDGPDVDIGRLAAALPLPLRPVGIRLCATGHAGAARLPVDPDAALVLAAGVGLRAAGTIGVGAGRLVPYAEIRGLAARSTGRLFGIDVDASGLAVGGEGGVRATFGRWTVRVAGSVDGLDDGLGVTPYPDFMGELGVGVRF